MLLAKPTKTPYAISTAGIVTYSGILLFLHARRTSREQLRAIIKSISACHSIATTVLTLSALSQTWVIPPHDYSSEVHSPTKPGIRLDDSSNSLVAGVNSLANHLTAWEAGYLIYDTGALLLEAYNKSKKPNRARNAIVVVVKESPVTLVHHIVLASAFLYLQTYIAERREKGVKIIVAFLLMNASTPLLHLRWWRKKVSGHRNTVLDIAVAVAFALSRFGTVYWILRAYGKHHSLGPINALRKQRWQCQTGTGMLVGLNLLWWLGLVHQMAKSRSTRKIRTQ